MSRDAPASPDAHGVGRHPFASRRSPLNETVSHTSHTRVAHCVTLKLLNTRCNTGITQTTQSTALCYTMCSVAVHVDLQRPLAGKQE
eukprot:163955-Prymnesium_polylepis.1